MAGKGDRLEALQVLRAIAAAMVVYVHALSTFKMKVGGLDLIPQNFGLGELGVKLFFCISGFIIYSSSESLVAGWVSVSYFIRRRLIRIVPLYWSATLIYTVKLGLQGSTPDFYSIFYSLFFIPYADEFGMMRPVLGVGWTLNYEMLFYLVLGCALFLPGRVRLIGVTSSMLFMAWLRYTGFLTGGSGFYSEAIYLLSDTYLIFFVVGILIGRINKTRFIKYMPKLSWPYTISIVSCILLMLLFINAGYSLTNGVALLLEMIACGVCLLFCITGKSSNNANKISLLHRLAVLAGDGSYSTYLIHGFIMGISARLVNVLPHAFQPSYFAVLMVVLCTGVGMMIYQLAEKPLLKVLNLKWGSKNEKNITYY